MTYDKPQSFVMNQCITELRVEHSVRTLKFKNSNKTKLSRINKALPSNTEATLWSFELSKKGQMLTSITTSDSQKWNYLSRLMGKPAICICENKGADQLRGNRETDQRLCFRYSDSTIPPLLISKISGI